MIRVNAFQYQNISTYISLGSNLGDKIIGKMRGVLKQLSMNQRIEVCKISNFYQSSPIQARGENFVNAVALLKTNFQPIDLLNELKNLEKQYGRTAKTYKNAPRTLDLDLLLYGNLEIQSEELCLPHPRMYKRAFVLIPLMDISPELQIPPEGKKIRTLLRKCLDQKINLLENS